MVTNHITSVLLVLASFGAINASAEITDSAGLAEKWALAEPITTFVQETNTLTMTFEVGDSIIQDNLRATIWEKGCKEEGIELNDTDGIEGVTTAIQTTGIATLSFSLDTKVLKDNSRIFTAFPNENKAEMKLCARFMLQIENTVYEINSIENIITVIFDLTAGFALAIEVTQKEPPDPGTNLLEKDYGVDAYLCDPENPEISLNENTFSPGMTISVCVTPDETSKQEGIFMQSIDSFSWSRGMIEQPAIEGSLAAGNSLTSLTCDEGSVVCSFSSILYSDFFLPPTQPPSEVPTGDPVDATSSPSEFPSTVFPAAYSSPSSQTDYPGTVFPAAYPTWSPTWSSPADYPSTVFPAANPYSLDAMREGGSPSPFPIYLPTYPPSTFPTHSNRCEGKMDVILDFQNATVKNNTLGVGGELRYGNIVSGRNDIDLLVTSFDYTISNNAGTGIDSYGNFGEIRVRGKANDAEAGSGTFKFCFVYTDGYMPQTMPSFQWSVFDIDALREGNTERMYFDTSQAAGYSLFPNVWESAIKTYCESEGKPGDCEGRTVFEGSYLDGMNTDPTDPNNLTLDQMKRGVVFTFVDKACWTMTYEEVCLTKRCAVGVGSNFLFSSAATQIVDKGETTCDDPSGETYFSGFRRMEEKEQAKVGDIGTTILKSGNGSRRMEDDKPEVGGTGTTTLKFGSGSRRKLSDGGRKLQDSKRDIGVTVKITEYSDERGALRTAGGMPVRGTTTSMILAGCLLLIGSAIVLL